MTSSSNGPDRSRRASGFAFLARVYWMLFGYVPVVASLPEVSRTDSSASLADLAYFASVAALLAVRLADIRWLAGTTSEGEPATLAHWRRYALTISLFAVVAWLVARGIRGS